MKATSQQIQAAVSSALAKSTEPVFRARLLAEPVATLNEVGGLDLPLNAAIRFTEGSEPIPVLLPAFGSDPDEITDDEILGSVSGGVTPVFVTAAVAVIAIFSITAANK